MLRCYRQIHCGTSRDGDVVYWMRREQRVRDNWALLAAQDRALEKGQDLRVLFCFDAARKTSGERHADFLLKGLGLVAQELRQLNIPFTVLLGEAKDELPRWCIAHNIAELVTDFSPLRQDRQDLAAVSAGLPALPLTEVDAHNIVPCWVVSDKQEYGAYTLRNKLHRLLPHYLVNFPQPRRQQPRPEPEAPPDWTAIRQRLSPVPGPPPVFGIESGSLAAFRRLQCFINEKLAAYSEKHNDPVADIQSGLSPYLHFGHIAPQRVALEVLRAESLGPSSEAFLEQLVVRRELADNYCYYNDVYDDFAGLPAWSRATLLKHRPDRRDRLYLPDQLAAANTDDSFWNAAQTELVQQGKIHGYMRMYWAKRLLEWTEEPAQALSLAIALNDRYALDGNDPNGYANIAWCIGGLHDRPWPERPIFGKVRYMNANGLRRKFRMDDYIRKMAALDNKMPPSGQEG